MIIVLGVAGSGKSTQSQLLAARDGMSWLSMGELLRRVITDERKETMLAGKVLDESETIAILSDELDVRGDAHEIILDGFPRGLRQAEWLLSERAKGRFDIRGIVHLLADTETVKARLLARGRQDDTEEAIKERFNEYEHTIKPIVAAMASQGVPVVEVNGEQAPTVVLADIVQKLQSAGVNV